MLKTQMVVFDLRHVEIILKEDISFPSNPWKLKGLMKITINVYYMVPEKKKKKKTIVNSQSQNLLKFGEKHVDYRSNVFLFFTLTNAEK